ncbi:MULTISPECIES: DUF3800 domain-containing protein [unclassified Methylobacterium]|uniref:DUF3800 domain-containing protein n=1 Tax=unclassified Methylobacterium TaxID=2615210 RepID=UPI00226A4F40|nr:MULTISPECIES: DUF3800 domain-containing protein [unclassified Methylobacterium]
MLFVYVDDFGHSGPYVRRSDPRHNTSPVYGFAGFALPAEELRGFSSFFLQLKQHNLSKDIEAARKPVYRWEKKGTNLFTKNSIKKYRAVREMGFRLLGEVKKRNGFVFYHGREKERGDDARSPVGLQTTVLSHAIRKLDRAASQAGTRFALVMDQSSSRSELLECAQKTMFGAQPCRQLVSPPFEVESHLDQSMQAADWIATLVGRVWAWRLDPEGFAEYSDYDRYFSDRLQRAASFSSVEKRTEIPRNYVVRGQSAARAVLIEQKSVETVIVTPETLQTTVSHETTTISLRRYRKPRG